MKSAAHEPAFLKLESMATDARKAPKTDQQKAGKTGTWRMRQGSDVVRKDTSGVPILRFGKGNNFHRFKQALSEELRQAHSKGELFRTRV